MTCPSCGYCPHCGRSASPYHPGGLAPYYPYPYQPGWPYPQGPGYYPWGQTTGGNLGQSFGNGPQNIGPQQMQGGTFGGQQ